MFVLFVIFIICRMFEPPSEEQTQSSVVMDLARYVCQPLDNVEVHLFIIFMNSLVWLRANDEWSAMSWKDMAAQRKEKEEKWQRFGMLIFMVGKMSPLERTHNSNFLSAFSSPTNDLTIKKKMVELILFFNVGLFLLSFFSFSWLSSAPVQEIKLLRPKIISKIKKKD